MKRSFIGMTLRTPKPIKIVINALSGSVGGGLTGFQCLLPKLGEINCPDEVIVIISPGQKSIRNIIPQNFKVRFVFFESHHLLARILYEQLALPFLLFQWGADLLYSVGNTTSLLAPCKIILLVENASPYSNLTFPWSWDERIRLLMLKIIGYCSMRRADKVRFVSENSRKIFSKKFKFLEGKSIVIAHGFSRVSAEQKICQNKDPFILTVSTVAPYKNIERIVTAFGYLVNEYHYSGNLIIVGRCLFGKYKEKILSDFVPDELKTRIIFTGEKTPEELPYLYRFADAFVFVSLIETFGLPVLEAMGYGAPVIVGKSTDNVFNPFNEICGEGAAYCDPFDPKDIARIVHFVISDEEKRKAIIRIGRQRAELFKWESVAHLLHDCFHTVVRESH